MDELFQSEVFEGFGLDRLMPYHRSELCKVESDDRENLRGQVRTHVPRVPGVYGMIDAAGRLVYVGKSKALRSRLLSYFMPTNEDEKSGRIIDTASAIVWETQPTDLAALFREQSLIRRFQPRFNRVGIPNRQQPIFVCLGRGPAEMFYTSRKIDDKAKSCQGPFSGAKAANRAVDILNRVFGLRDCNSKTKFTFGDQLQLFAMDSRAGCLRHEIGNCLAPCTQDCSRSKYSAQVEQAIEYLQTGNVHVQQAVELQMQHAAEHQHFERAARLRDDLRAVKWLSNRLAHHAETRRDFNCIYPIDGMDQRHIWYCIRNGVAEHAIQAPRTEKQYQRCLREIERWFQTPETINQIFVGRNETIAIVDRWFRKYTQEKRKVLRLEKLPSSLRALKQRNSKLAIPQPA